MIWFAILILLHLFLFSFKLNILLQLASLGIFFIAFKPTVSVTFIKKIAPLIFIFLIGALGTIVNEYKMFNVVKDILHFLKPIIGLLIGYFFMKQLNNERKFFKLVVVIGLLSATYHYFLVFVKSDLSSGSIHAFRLLAQDNYFELLALFFLIIYKKVFDEAITKPLYFKIAVAFLTLSVLLYFSRIMMVIAIVFFLNFYGFTKITIRNIKIIGVMIIGVLLLYLYLFNVKLRTDAPGLEGFLFKIKMAPAEVFNAKLDKENMMYLGENWRAYEAKRAFDLMNTKPASYVFGTGYGSLVNLGFWAPLGDYKKGMKYISELHNGYMYVFYKTGAVGLLFYLYFLLNLYSIINKDFSFNARIISGIGVAFLFTSLVFGGVYNYRDIFTFILGGMMYFYYDKKYIT
jgi:hypothetical protein